MSERSAKIGPLRRFGPYLLVKKLATGGMAEIWLARQTALAGFSRFIVIKKILSHLAEEASFLQMFKDEARTSAQLTHPNVVQVYNVEEAEGTCFIVMEFIAGENLSAIQWRGVKNDEPLPPAYAARIVADALKGLHYAHHKRGQSGAPLELVHRDISPQNILVTYEGEVKVVDFGIAKAASQSQHTKTGMLKGKFSYMSPEQCLGDPLDMRSDLFSVGVVLYELLTGKRLYKHDSELMILEMITKRRVTPPGEVVSGLHPDLDAIVMKALEKDPAQRFQTGQEFQLALEEFLRTSDARVSNTDVGAYVGRLFFDKLEEKRMLCEEAARDDVEIVAYHAGEGDRARPDSRRDSQASWPSVSRATGLSGTQNFRGATAIPSVTQVLPARSAAPYYAVMTFALFVVASVMVYFFADPFGTATETSAQIALGALKIESEPSGSMVYVDGERLNLEDGEPAKTPIEALSNLRYGQTYVIRWVREGYRTYELPITMDAKTDNRPLRPALEPLPASLIVRVAGPDASLVEIFVNDRREGAGPILEREFAPGRINLRAETPGKVCAVEPENLDLEPGRGVSAEVRCEKPNDRRNRRTQLTRSSAPTRERDAAPAAPKSDCEVLRDVPSGFVTIDTQPPSIVSFEGHALGETPLAKAKLPAGCIRLELKTLDSGKSFTKIIQIEPNKTSRYSHRLE